jgi:leader peptidase (prepilin peptidase)/N-methyltransferase
VAAGLSLVYLWWWATLGAVGPTDALGRFLAAAVIVTVFLLIAVIDVEHRLILRVVVVPAAAVVAFLGLLAPGRGAAKTLLGGLAGYAIVFGIYLLAQLYMALIARLRGRPLEEVAFGGGDVNLAAVVGFAVGWPGVLLALLIAIVAGGLYSLGLILFQIVRGRYSPHGVIPYGPFLILGALAIYLHGRDIAAWWLGGP